MNESDMLDAYKRLRYLQSFAVFARALTRGIWEVKNALLAPFTHDWESGIPTGEDVKFSQEIWRKGCGKNIG